MPPKVSVIDKLSTQGNEIWFCPVELPESTIMELLAYERYQNDCAMDIYSCCYDCYVAGHHVCGKDDL